MAQNWTHDTGDRIEEVQVVQQPGYEVRQEIVTDVYARQVESLRKITQLIWLMFALLEGLIVLRILLKLIGANPSSPFAALTYAVTDLFLWPFFGLTSTPSVGSMVLEIPSLIAMLVYALVGWAVVKVLWLLFPQRPTTTISTYERDGTPRY